MSNTGKIVQVILLYIMWLGTSITLALMSGPIYGPVVLVALLISGTLLLAIGLQKLLKKPKT